MSTTWLYVHEFVVRLAFSLCWIFAQAYEGKRLLFTHTAEFWTLL